MTKMQVSSLISEVIWSWRGFPICVEKSIQESALEEFVECHSPNCLLSTNYYSFLGLNRVIPDISHHVIPALADFLLPEVIFETIIELFPGSNIDKRACRQSQFRGDLDLQRIF